MKEEPFLKVDFVEGNKPFYANFLGIWKYCTTFTRVLALLLSSGLLSGSAFLLRAMSSTDVSHFRWFSLGYAVSFFLLAIHVWLVWASNGKAIVIKKWEDLNF